MLSMKFDGGKAVVQRILQAYGFTMQKQLHDHLGVGNGTVSTWIKRNYFPGEVVIRCALETGADLEWLATGSNVKSKLSVKGTHSEAFLVLPYAELRNGEIYECGDYLLDTKLHLVAPKNPIMLRDGNDMWLIEQNYNVYCDGIWLFRRNDTYCCDVISAAPSKKLIINNVEWPENEIKLCGMATLRIEKLVRG